MSSHGFVSTNSRQFISKIKKENFDLKLELFHRRQRAEALEVKFAHVEDLEKSNEELSRDNEEMQSINEDLLKELENRDLAIREAVGLICELESKLEKVVNADRSSVRSGSAQGKSTPDQSPSQAFARSGSAAKIPRTPSPTALRPKPKARYNEVAHGRVPESMPPPSKPSPKARPVPPKQPRTPLFLQKKDPSTQALRNVYGTDGVALKSTHSLASMHRAHSNRTRNGQRARADADNHTLPSPRFSELSEGDFESVYGANLRPSTPPRRSLFNQEPLSDARISERSAQRLSRSYSSQDSKIDHWVHDTRKSTSPTRHEAAPRKSDNAFHSIEAVIGSRKAPLMPLPVQFRDAHGPPPVFTQPIAKYNAARPPASFGGPIFSGDILPPTPDTMSTSHKGTNRSNPSIVTEKSFVDKPTLDEFTKRVSEQRPHTSEGSRNSAIYDARRYDDSDLEAEDEDPYLHASDIPPRPPPHKISDPSFSNQEPLHDLSERPRLNIYSTEQSTAISRTMSYPTSETTARRRSSVQHSATSPNKTLVILGQPFQEAYTPSDKSVKGGVSLLQQQPAPSPTATRAVSAIDATIGHTSKQLSKTTGPAAVAKFFRRSSIQTPNTILVNQQQLQSQQGQQHQPSQQTRSHFMHDYSPAHGRRRASFHNIAKPPRIGRPSTSGEDGTRTGRTITAAAANGVVPFAADEDTQNVNDGVVESNDQKAGAKGIGFGIGKKLAGLGRRGSKGARR